MADKTTVILDEKIGVCVKTADNVVFYQNDTCRKICGNMGGQLCEKGCMKVMAEKPAGSMRENDFMPFKNAFPEDNVIDGVLIKNNGFLTTLLFDSTRAIDEQMQLFTPYGLTHTEGLVVRMVLEGATNVEIAKKFNIARSTLKSHLNRIYRKVPSEIRDGILARRGGSSKAGANQTPSTDEAS